MKKFTEKLTNTIAKIAEKLGNQIHLLALRDAFASIMPFMILAGFVTLINWVILDPSSSPLAKIVDPELLGTLQKVAMPIGDATLGIMTLLIVVTIALQLSKYRQFDNPIAPILTSLVSFFVVTPMSIEVLTEGSSTAITVGGIGSGFIGASGMFVGILIGLIATDIVIRLSRIEKLQIKISGQIPPSVISSFNVLIPVIITVFTFAILNFTLAMTVQMTLSDVVSKIITTPLSHVTTGLFGFVLITSIANLFFGFGIHQAVISSSLLDPFLLQNMSENMTAYQNNQEIPHIINMAFKDTFAVMGGSGNTIALLIAIFIFGKRQDYKDIAKLSTTPAIFNISEPIIFGLPIVFNISLIIPFVLAPIFSLVTAYYATSFGLINPVVVQTPWTT
ncbi:MAG: PTS sugar transporter subunit IIC, partial [Erysipelothrix sp.]|nr:PTS sugar transporter subunit IIC [Erysipelothrix sp.]